MVSNASDDLPDPDSPVTQTSALRGMRTVTFFRLCSRAPWTTSASVWLIGASLYPGEQTFGNGLLVGAARHRTRRSHGRARALYGYGVVVVVVSVGCEDVPPSSPPAVSDAFIW